MKSVFKEDSISARKLKQSGYLGSREYWAQVKAEYKWHLKISPNARRCGTFYALRGWVENKWCRTEGVKFVLK